MSSDSLSFLGELETTIRQRAGQPSPDSYTSRLLQQGIQRVAQKVGEEAVELALAAVAGERQQQLEEAADLLYHLLVLLTSRDLALAEVVAVLESRHRR